MEKEQEVTLEVLTECLLSFFDLMPRENKINQFVFEIAKQTLKKCKAGQNLEITTKDIFFEMYPNKDENSASSTLANLWKNIPKLHNQVVNRLAEHARNNHGLNYYPWIEKIDSAGGAGNLAKYKVISKPINNTLLIGPNPYRDTVAYDIEYIAVQDYEPSWIARLLFDQSYSVIGLKKWLMIFLPLLQMLFYLALILMFVLVTHNQTLGNLSMYYLILIIGIAWLFLNKKNKFERFSEDRIIIASDFFMPWKEFSLLQEMVTIKDENENFLASKVQLTKYVAVCPICEAKVELERGEPDFPRRIIGRCKESPREHIYSFDRVTKLGVFLHQNAIRPIKTDGNKLKKVT